MNQQLEITREHKVIEKVNILVWIDVLDQPYASKLAPMFANASVRIISAPVESLHVMTQQLKNKGFTKVVTTRLDALLKLLPPGRIKKANLSNYTGSIIPFNGVEFLILPPLKQLTTVEYAPWMFKQLIRKVTHEHEWRKTSDFMWWHIKPGREFVDALKILEKCDIISVDTETVKHPRPAIELVQYTGFSFETNKSWTYVVSMNSMEAVHFMRKANALDVPKVLQNGKYDCAYFFAYNAPMTAYYYDLKNAMHAQYSELPKDLAFSSALWLRDIMYWKDLSGTGDQQDKLRYGAMDTWATGEAFISWMQQAPDWAKRNYVTEFQLTPALHMCEMRGIKRDMVALHKHEGAGQFALAKKLEECRAYTGSPKFNPSSPDQTLRLLCILTGQKIPPKVKIADLTEQEKRQRLKANKAAIQKASYAHPINERVLGAVLEYRQIRKELGTYLTVGEKAKEFGPVGKERILYSINQDGTDTARCASKEHHFWCGLQIQNMKGGGTAKSTLVADEGFAFAEADYSQAEDRGVAYSSGDPTLMGIFTSDVDSHCYKAAMFFGIPYEDICQDARPEYINNETGLLVPATKKKILMPDTRQLGKRINHGANYNMGSGVLLETMGPKAVREAQKLLKLPASWPLLKICDYLLQCYEKAFPTVKKEYYKSIILQIKRTSMMVSDTGWVRFCFGNPEASKPALNKYVAHKTQNLNAMNLNKAFLIVFKELGFNSNFKLLAQIHDSILFQFRLGHEHLVERVRELMTFPVPITDCFGITRDLIVPVDVKILGRTWAGTNE